jgi:hypothetical protein
LYLVSTVKYITIIRQKWHQKNLLIRKKIKAIDVNEVIEQTKLLRTVTVPLFLFHFSEGIYCDILYKKKDVLY